MTKSVRNLIHRKVTVLLQALKAGQLYGFLFALVFLPALLGSQRGHAQTTYLSEDFETAWTGTIAAPTGWTQIRSGSGNTGAPTGGVQTDGRKDFQQVSISGTTFTANGVQTGAINTTHYTMPLASSFSGSGTAWYNDYYNATNATTAGAFIRELRSPAVNTTSTATGYVAGSELHVTFLYYYPTNTMPCSLMVAQDGTNFTLLAVVPSTGTNGGLCKAMDYIIPDAKRGTGMKVEFKIGASYGSSDMFIDNFKITDNNPASIFSTAGTNPNTTTTVPSATDVQVFRTAITTGAGIYGTYTLTGLNLGSLNTNDADVTNVNLWTGTSAAPVTKITTGTKVFSGGTLSFTGLSSSIATGSASTYIWVTYDLSSTAANGNLVGAKLPAGGLTFTNTTGALSAGTQPSAVQTGTTRTVTAPMTFNSQTVSRPATGPAFKGSSYKTLDVTVNTSTGGSVNLTALNFSNTSGTVGDITSAKLYYSTTNFTDSTLIGTVANPAASFSFTPTQALAPGNNYFRLNYTVSATAVNFNVLNAAFVSSVIDGTTRTCTINCSPSGNFYAYSALASSVTENFEATIPNTGWSAGTSNASLVWSSIVGSSGTAPAPPGDATGSTTARTARLNSGAQTGTADLISPLAELTNRGSNAANITFWVYRDANAGNSGARDQIEVWLANTKPVNGAAMSAADATLLYVVCRSATQNTLPAGLPTGSTNNNITPGVAGTVGANSWNQYTAAIPAGYTGSYYVVFRGVGISARNQYLDEISIPVFPTYQTYISSTSLQQTGDIVPGTAAVNILQIPVVTTGSTNALSVKGFNFSTNGSTNAVIAASGSDISRARVYYSGTTSTFTGPGQSGSSQFGSDVTSSAGTFAVTGTQTLVPGTNYFWLVYDVSAGATTGDVIDGEVTDITLIDNSTPRIPTTTAPSGNRGITAPATVTAASVSQLSNGVNVNPGTTDVQMLGLNLTIGTGAAIPLNSLVFNTTSATAISALTSAKLYYTATGSTFSTATQLGTTVTSLSSGADFTFTPTTTLNLGSGTYYFWLVYNVKSSASTYDLLDASLTKFTANGIDYSASGSPAVGTPNPTGYRLVYNTSPQTTENFNAAIPNTGWTVYGSSADITWQNMVANSVSNPTINVDGAGSATGKVAYFNSYADTYPAGTIADLVSPELSLSNRGANNAIVSFSTYRSNAFTSSPDYLMVWLSPTKPTSTAALPAGSTLLYYINRINTKTDAVSGTPTTAGANNGFTPTIAGSETVGWHTYSVNLPASAAGYIVFRAVSGYGDNIVLDEIGLPTFEPAMAFSAASTSPTNATLPLGVTGARMQQVKITTTGVTNAISLKTLNLSTAGTTLASDILNAKVYFTGNSATFASTTQFGSTVTSPAATFAVNGTQQLLTGDNYFWVTYDVTSTGASQGNTVAATISSYVLNSAPVTNASISGGTASRVLMNPMTLVGTPTLSYPSSDPLFKGSTGNVIAKLDIEMSTGAALDLGTLTFTGTGSTAFNTDVVGAKIVSTGTSATYNAATATTLATFTALPMTFTGAYTLSAGHNYFWLLYDVSSNAVRDDILGTRLTSVKITGISPDPITAATTPTGTAPTIQNPVCSTGLHVSSCTTTGNYIKSVAVAAPANSPSTVTTLSNSNTNCPAGSAGYSYYPPSVTTSTLTAGVSYTISVTPSLAGKTIGVWLDADRNGTFAASEYTQVTAVSAANTAATASFTVPNLATTGLAILRVRVETGLTANDACLAVSSGETEDYFVSLVAPSACSGTPVAGTITGPATGCNGLAAKFTLSGQTTGYTGLSYKWRSSTTSGGTFTDIQSATSATYTTGTTFTSTTYFKAAVTCGGTTTETPEFTYTFNAPDYSSLPYSQGFESAWASECGSSDAPDNSWRSSSAITGDAAWKRNDDPGVWTPATVNDGTYFPFGSSGSHSARFHSSTTSAVSNFDLFVNLGSAGSGAKRLAFDYINTDGNDALSILISTNGGTSFTGMGTFYTNADWTTQTVLIPASFTGNAVVRFQGQGQLAAANGTDIGLDNVEISISPACTQPSAGTIAVTPPANPCSSKTYTFTLHDYSTEDGISIQWWRSTNNGVTFSNLGASAQSPVLLTDVPLSNTLSNTVTSYLIKAVVTCANGSTSDEIIQQVVVSPPAAGTLPATQSFCLGKTVTLTPTGAATGLSYQWESSPSGNEGTWVTVSGATSLSYSFTPIGSSTTYYRLKVSCGTKFSSTNILALVPVTATYASLPFIESFESTWQSRCSNREVPSASWFQLAPNEVSDPGTSWRRDDDGVASGGWPGTDGAYSPAASSGSHSARFDVYDAPESLSASMLLYLNLTGLASNRLLTFDYNNEDGNDDLVVSTSTDDGTTWSTQGTFTTTNGWVAKSVNLNGLTTAKLIIRFTATSDYGVSDIGLDNVVVAEPCNGALAGDVPASVIYCGTSPAVISASATVSKPLSAGPGIAYQWQVRTSASPETWADVSTGTGGTTISYTTAGSMSGTGYYRLKVTCNASATAYSDVVTVNKATVTPAVVTAAAPYVMSFENTWLDGCASHDKPGAEWLQLAPDFSSDAGSSWRRNDDGASAGWPAGDEQTETDQPWSFTLT
ncbi:MAG: BNR-repeat neuraminidase N-terminal domain-containing protein [Bacteroidota bacterium]